MKKRNWKTRKYLETVRENCPNCGKELSFRMYVEATEFDSKTGKPTEEGWDFVHGEKECGCGASLLIADDYEHFNIYWLNKKEMDLKKEMVAESKLKELPKDVLEMISRL